MKKTLEQIIEIVSERAIEVIDDSLYEMIGKDEDDPDEFYEDYKEVFGHVVEQLNKFHNVED